MVGVAQWLRHNQFQIVRHCQGNLTGSILPINFLFVSHFRSAPLWRATLIGSAISTAHERYIHALQLFPNANARTRKDMVPSIRIGHSVLSFSNPVSAIVLCIKNRKHSITRSLRLKHVPSCIVVTFFAVTSSNVFNSQAARGRTMDRRL